jgi:hypothetical protein
MAVHTKDVLGGGGAYLVTVRYNTVKPFEK